MCSFSGSVDTLLEPRRRSVGAREGKAEHRAERNIDLESIMNVYMYKKEVLEVDWHQYQSEAP